MQFELIKPSSRTEWDDYVSRHEFGHYMQSYAWGELQKNSGWHPEYYLCYDNNTVRAAVLILSRIVPLIGKRICYAPRGPVFDPNDTAILPLLMTDLHALLARNGSIFLRCDPYFLVENTTDALFSNSGFVKLTKQWSYWNAPKTVFWLDLQSDEDTLFRNLNSTCRNEVRAGYKHGIEFIQGSEDDLDDFQRLMVSMGVQKGIAVKNRKYFHELFQYLICSTKVKLFFARYQGNNIAAGMSVILGNKAWLLYAASDKKFSKLKPNRTLQWEMIKWARDEGCVRYDFRGTAVSDPPQTDDPGYGVYQFKKSFGPKYTQLAGYYDQVYNPSLYRVFRFGEDTVLPLAYNVKAWSQGLSCQLLDKLKMLFKKDSFFYILFYALRTFKQTALVEYGPGLFNLAKKAYFSLLRVNRFEVYVYNGADMILGSPDGDYGVKITEFSRLDKYRCFGTVPKELCCDKAHKVTSCRIVQIDNELAYIHWVYTKGDHSRFIHLGDGIAEINNVLTLPKFRGKNIAARILHYSAKQLHQEGYRNIVAVIHDQNIASIKAFIRAGFVKTCVIKALGPFNGKISLL